jgi:hypothetical protein
MRLVDEPKSCAISAQFILFEVLSIFPGIGYFPNNPHALAGTTKDERDEW